MEHPDPTSDQPGRQKFKQTHILAAVTPANLLIKRAQHAQLSSIAESNPMLNYQNLL
ncbi:hypothetical protein WAI453_011455 [Rhynchosporium graminicola]